MNVVDNLATMMFCGVVSGVYCDSGECIRS